MFLYLLQLFPAVSGRYTVYYTPCKSYMVLNECIFSGSVTPALSGVKIKLEAAALNPKEVSVETDSKGAYSLGPFPR